MKWIFAILYTVFIIIIPVNANAQANSSPKTYAVIIGISQYEDASIPALQFADKDAKAFSDWLQSKAGGKVPSANTRLLVNGQATIAAISSAFDWLREVCTENDIAYIFFSGHGDVETKTIDSLGYLLAYNTPPNNYRNNAIRIADINSDATTLSVLRKSKVILITDACHSGKLAGDAYGGRQLAARQLRLMHENEVRLASCAPDQLSAEGPQWGGGRGVFSYYLINGLQGMADNAKDGKIVLKEIQYYLDSCFAGDKELQQQKHQQQPVVKGDPDFSLARVDNNIMLAAKSPLSKAITKSLDDIKPATLTPVDSLFNCLAAIPVEGIINFTTLTGIPAEEVPAKFLTTCIGQYKMIDSFYQVALLQKGGEKQLPSVGTLQKLLEAVKRKNIAGRFNTYLCGFIHTRAQQMINNYLKGDRSEMDRREYYYTGNEKYSDFLAMHQLGFSLLTTDNRLYKEMEMQQAYLSGLIARLQMNSISNKDSLLKTAFRFQYKALALDEGAAYVHNEMGILFAEKKQFDSASYHLRFATDMAPTWALPWSNLVALNTTTGNLKMASAADSIAKQLQPETDLILVNEGILMERLNNLLAAGAAYRKAIAINDRHYLPYACLGYCYIKTGDYALADSLLYEANMRLNGLGIDRLADAMEIASDAGHRMKLPKPYPDDPDTSIQVPGKKVPKEFDWLHKGLLQFRSGNMKEAENLLTKATTINANIPLANHYLGVMLVKQSRWKEAANCLNTAIQTFYTKDSLRSILSAALQISSSIDANNTIVEKILSFSYAAKEDYFLQAKQYEKRGLNNQAVDAYLALAAKEKFNKGFLLPYIRSARLLYEMGDFTKAEALLINEYELMKKSGDAASITWNEFADIKSEIYAFYERQIKQFPGQAEWNKKAGLFLFQQVEPVFTNAGAKYHNYLYQGFSILKYPLLQTMEAPDTFVVNIPGTDDIIEMTYPAINAVAKAADYFRKTLQLWGGAEKPFDVVFALAKLNSWMGNKKEAVKWFEEALDIQTNNSIARNVYLQYLQFTDELMLAMEQLENLKKQKQATPDQLLLLANYQALSGQYNKAETLLQECAAANETDHRQVMQSFITLWYLSGNTKKALQFVTDSIKATTNEQEESFRLYSIARYTSIAGDVKKGFELLKRAIEKGFKKYYYVLDNDKAWATVRQTKEWATVMSQATQQYYLPIRDENKPDFDRLISPYWY